MVAIETIASGRNPAGVPFTIVLLANVALEIPWQSGVFTPDGVLTKRSSFDGCVRYVVDALHGRLPNTAEPLLSDPSVLGRTRILSIFDPTLPVNSAHAFVGLDRGSSLLIARRNEITTFLAMHGIVADVVYAITVGDERHTRASAWYTTDDSARGGKAFVIDGTTSTHCFHAAIPGCIAMHVGASGPTAAHEFCHAISSYQNGSIVDLYADSSAGINNKRGRPIPPAFATLDGTTYQSDPHRDHIGYPAGWRSYHSELHDLARPALMDNYHLSSIPLACPNDKI